MREGEAGKLEFFLKVLLILYVVNLFFLLKDIR